MGPNFLTCIKFWSVFALFRKLLWAFVFLPYLASVVSLAASRAADRRPLFSPDVHIALLTTMTFTVRKIAKEQKGE